MGRFSGVPSRARRDERRRAEEEMLRSRLGLENADIAPSVLRALGRLLDRIEKLEYALASHNHNTIA